MRSVRAERGIEARALQSRVRPSILSTNSSALLVGRS
jgi:hypothetical protein